MAFCGYLKISTSVDILLGPFMDDADGDTADTDATIDVELSKNGQALADSESAAPTHDAAGTVDGYYNCILGTTDTNTLGILTVVAHHADDLPVRQDYQVVTANWFDSMCSTDKLDTSLVQILGTAVAETTGANIATNFNTFFDDGDSAISTAIMSYIEELAAANLPADVAACNTVTPDAVGTAATAIAAAHTTTDAKIDTTDGLIAALNNVSTANLNTACDTVTVTSIGNDVITAASINTGAIAADAVGATALDNVVMSDLAAVPAATASIVAAINWIFEVCRNRMVTNTTNDEIELYKDDATTKLAESGISDDGTDFDREEFGTPD